MRPIRLEIQGFMAFRERVEIDFSDCDFFALCGPTGAGKSSIIDAIAFALYGAVPRLDRSQVAPVITQQELEARVRLEFSVGTDRYTAVRVVRRQGAGASTREARLERDGTPEPIAADAKGMTEAVEQILGLTFEHFTKCVVLPQGEFSEFLHAKPAARQELLVNLLGMQMYRLMGQRARQLADGAKARADWLTQRLEGDEFTFATPEALADAKERLVAVQGLWEQVEAATPRAQELKAAIEESRALAEVASKRAMLLEGITPPATLGQDAGALTRARTLQVGAAAATEAAERRRVDADATVAALPQHADLKIVHDAHQTMAAAQTNLAAGMAAAREAELVESEAVKAAEAASQEYEAALDALSAVRTAHAAHAVAQTLVAGESCPVCLQTVAALPDLAVPEALSNADAIVAATAKALELARAAVTNAQRARTHAEAGAEALQRQIAELAARTAIYPDPSVLDQLIGQVLGAAEEQRAALASERAARAAHQEAERAVAAAQQAQAAARRDLMSARDQFASAIGQAPPVAGDDLQADWRALCEWAQTQANVQHEAAARALADANAAAQERAQLAQTLEKACIEAGVQRETKETSITMAVMSAVAEQQSGIDRTTAALEQIATVDADRKVAQEESAVSAKLGQHLSAKGFEKWLLDEAVTALVTAATTNLRELSGGAYSLTCEEKTGAFWVIDHRNADERRQVRTLSGGETFLASLSLALALSDGLTQMAAEGARLDSMFLDEGFGTLDVETLDVVASAIETLAAGGRMVGLVTHVAQIADRVPIRFEVRKIGDTSTVEKVFA